MGRPDPRAAHRPAVAAADDTRHGVAYSADPLIATVTNGGVVSPKAVRWAAEQVVRMHAEAPPHTIEAWAEVPLCARCQPDHTCALLAWAEAAIVRGEVSRPAGEAAADGA